MPDPLGVQPADDPVSRLPIYAVNPGDMAALLFAIDAHLELAARSAAETLAAIGAARARLADLRRMMPWATTPTDTE